MTSTVRITQAVRRGVLTLLGVAAAIAASAPTAAAQFAETLPSGAQVRVNGRCPPSPQIRVTTGRLAHPVTVVDDVRDTLFVHTSGGARTIAPDQVYTLETRRGANRWSRWLVGAGIGMAVGALVTGTATYYASSSNDAYRELSAFLAALAGGASGALVGGVVGVSTAAGWRRVGPLECR